jgi:F-type H+-transporting ATPase subunit b
MRPKRPSPAIRERAQGIARASRETMTAEIAKQRAEIDAQIGGQTADAEHRINAQKDVAVGHIAEIATEAAEALVARFTGKPVSRPELISTVNEVLGK